MTAPQPLQSETSTTTDPSNLIEITLDKSLNFEFHANAAITVLISVIVVGLLLSRLLRFPRRTWRSFEINEAEFGLGDHRIKLSPNITDQQIAYKIWVELSTRKIGLPIDIENDVISEIYDSWFNFFSVTRELIKDVPVQKFHRKDTEQIVRLSIEVLNQGIRPHLTRWQARFRRWYEYQLRQDTNSALHPQEIQKKFPHFEELERDLRTVNDRLIKYREMMYEIVKAS